MADKTVTWFWKQTLTRALDEKATELGIVRTNFHYAIFSI
jgi:hypothetical protein